MTVLQNLNKRLTFYLFALNFLAVLPLPFIYLRYGAEDPIHTVLFTDHMRYYGGIAPVLTFFIIIYEFYKNKQNLRYDYKMVAFLNSAILFFSGGIIALLISGIDVTIPAHYHGSIVGISLACMGLVYWLIENAGFGVINQKLARVQCHVFTVGQFMHIGGLAWSGGYGTLRKSLTMAPHAKMAMGLMGAGGLIAVIGGFLFIYNCVLALNKSKENL